MPTARSVVQVDIFSPRTQGSTPFARVVPAYLEKINYGREPCPHLVQDLFPRFVGEPRFWFLLGFELAIFLSVKERPYQYSGVLECNFLVLFKEI